MKKVKIAIISATLLIASAVNFGILTKNIGVNVAYACDPNTNYGNVFMHLNGCTECVLIDPNTVNCDPDDWDGCF